MSNQYVIAKYLRISFDDGTHSDQQSIPGQRDLIDIFIRQHPELKNSVCYEYCDDGYSGTTFKRPGVEKMLNDAKTGKINCIIVKDFSRFGRSYIDVGDYIEQIFPFLQVRFISINDHYDSSKQEFNAGNVSMAFKNLCNDYYSKDLSRKIRSGLKTLRESGKYLSSHALYGYRKNPEDKHQLIIDEVSSYIVRRIFDMALECKRPVEIAKVLNAEKVLTPMMYLVETRNVNPRKDNLTKLWTNESIIDIIRDLRYTGAITGGMCYVEQIGSRKHRKKPKSEWCIRENMHEPIVSKEEYEKAQLCIKKISVKPTPKKPLQTPFKIKICCGGCGHALVKSRTKESYYYCRFKDIIPDNHCFSDRFKADELYNTIQTALKQMYSLVIEQGREVVSTKGKISTKLLKELHQVQREVESLNNTKLNLYKKYCDGLLASDEYFSERKSSDEMIDELTSKKCAIEAELLRLENDVDENLLKAERACNSQILTQDSMPELAKALVDSVIIHDVDNVEIKWKFADTNLNG